jgi:selenoprotein W-related protein
LIWDRKADGGFPDAKTLKQRAPNHPARDLGPIDRAAAGKEPE